MSGIEPDPPEYETGARPIELRGQVPAVRQQDPFGEKGAAPAQAGERFVRPSEEAGSFQTRPKNERLYQLGYSAVFRFGRRGAELERAVLSGCGGGSWIRTNISIACMTTSGGRTAPTRGIEPPSTELLRCPSYL